MSEASDMIAFYASVLPDDITGDTIETCERIGFDVSEDRSEQGTRELRIRYTEGWLNVFVYPDEARPPNEPVVGISCGQLIKPAKVSDERTFRNRMSAVFELLCRLSVRLDVDYAPLFCPPNRRAGLDDRPIVENLEELPRIGVYDRTVVDQFGGLEAMFDTQPWYTAALEGDKIVVVETERPWDRVDWRPPNAADFLEATSVHVPTAAPDCDADSR